MSTRERMTWGGKSAAGFPLPVEAAKKASAHPATPDEGITHPAGYDDPKQPAAYENGNTSQWAEDPHPGPYRTSPAPANPMDDGGYRHPAAQPGAPAKNASDLRIASERKAVKCLRIASALLGPEISAAAESGDKVAVDLVEAQALDFMDLADDRIAATLRRLEAATEDEETLLRKMLAGDEGEEEEEVEEDEEETVEEKKEAAAKRAEDSKMAEVMSMLAALQAQVASLSGGHKAEEAPAVAEDEEAMLAAMLAEEAPAVASEDDEAEAMLAAMMAEEAPAVAEEAPAVAEEVAPNTAGKSLAQYLDDDMGGVMMDGLDDPMGLFEEPMLDSADDEILASLFASDNTAKKAEDEETEEEEVEVEEEDEDKADKSAAARTARAKAASADAKLRPQPKKPGAGVQSVGQVRVAGANDINDLARLWATAPDVTKVFGNS